MKSTQSNSLHSKSSSASCPIPATKFPEYPIILNTLLIALPRDSRLPNDSAHRWRPPSDSRIARRLRGAAIRWSAWLGHRSIEQNAILQTQKQPQRLQGLGLGAGLLVIVAGKAAVVKSKCPVVRLINNLECAIAAAKVCAIRQRSGPHCLDHETQRLS